MRKLYILCIIALALIITGLVLAEQITLTTYYPAPYRPYLSPPGSFLKRYAVLIYAFFLLTHQEKHPKHLQCRIKSE
jgi:hypothetical protein